MLARLVRQAIDARTAAGLLDMVEAHPCWLQRRGDGFDPYSSSLRLGALPAIDAVDLAASLLAGPAGESCRAGLGEAIAIGIDRCWIRRQYAPASAPERHAPHAWHQDGALGFDFLAVDAEPGATPPLQMRTCWISLTACGTDAPGLELVSEHIDVLLAMDELQATAVSRRAAEAQCWTPDLQAGDALVFDGGVLHRTHVAPAMRADRTSLELRFFAADRLPGRLQGERFVPIH